MLKAHDKHSFCCTNEANWKSICTAAASYHYPRLLLRIAWLFWELCSETHRLERYLITEHHLFLCISNQVTSAPLLLHSSVFTVACSCWTSLLLFTLLLNNRLMRSIFLLSASSTLISIYIVLLRCDGTLPCYCSVLYYCGLACVGVYMIDCMCNASGLIGFCNASFWTGVLPCALFACQLLGVF